MRCALFATSLFEAFYRYRVVVFGIVMVETGTMGVPKLINDISCVIKQGKSL